MAPAEPTATPVPAAPTAAAGPKRGGELRTTSNLQRLEDPAATQWTQFNVYRNVAEYLTLTNQDNITVPWLLDRWEASDDLLTWTLYLNQGIMFNHGPELTAEDVVFNFQRWLDPDTGSSTTGLMDYLTANDIEQVDDYTVRLHLSRPQIAVPEHLNHYPNVILSKDFEGNWVEQPVGTGPYTLEEYIVEERALVRRRDGYWRMGADNQPLPYMDSIRFINLGTDPAPALAALQSGEIDLTGVTAPLLETIEGTDILIATQVSSYTHVIRMRADKPPFDDVRVRNAIKACQDREAIRFATMRDYGALGEDHHVAPIHPEYCPMDPPERDIEKAKALLAEAGYEDGLDISMAVINSFPNIDIAQLLAEQCAPAGININLEMMPSSMYWEQWMEVDFGITSWTHRPLAVMLLSLAYKSGVPWNETHWSNEEFDSMLAEAEGTLDVEERRQIMCDIQTLMKEEGPIALPRYGAFLWGHHPKVKNYRGAPNDTIMLDEVWLDEEA
jgi:peptide/nickel transport system substrate-binding protein